MPTQDRPKDITRRDLRSGRTWKPQFPGRSRIAFIDAARSLAIALALFHHAMLDLRGWLMIDSSSRSVWLLVMRSATPLFVFLFGMMLEIVYQRRAERYGLRHVAPRLLKRGTQCYLGYLATVAAGVLGGMLTLREGAFAAAFLREAYFGNILKFYTFALMLAVPLLWLRRWKGIPAVLLVGLGMWLLDPLLARLPWPDGLLYLASLLFGVGDQTGPSVMNGMTFVAVGMAAGHALRGSHHRRVADFRRASGWILAACAIVVVYLALQTSFADVMKSYVNASVYRATNHPGYYALGTMSAVTLVLGLSWLIPLGSTLLRLFAVPLILGRSSLLAFTLGNVILNLRPRTFAPDAVTVAMLGAMGMVVLVIVLLHIETYLSKLGSSGALNS